MNKKNKYKMVYVKWVDSQFASQGWSHEKDINNEIATIETIGYLIKSKNKVYTIASSVSIKKEEIENQMTCVINIPKCCVVCKRVISF